MIFYKAWGESRTRFLVAALAMAGYCAFMIIFWRENQAPFSARMAGNTYSEYTDNLIFGSFGKVTFVVSAVFLGLGGLLRERAHRTAAFTLALPVSRAQVVGAQVAVGLTELALLALLPALLIPTLSAIMHQSYPIDEALRYSLVRFICGAFIFAIAFLFSVLVRGAYTAPMLCWGALFLQARVANWAPLRPYGLNPLRTMDGRWGWWQQTTINDPFPWAGLAIMLLIATALLAAATRVTQRQNL
jgi:ABC-2 type transport system permease protein